MRRIVPNDVSPGAELRNSFARTIVSRDARETECRARVSYPGETFSGPCLVVLAAIYPQECRTHLASIPLRNDDVLRRVIRDSWRAADGY